MVEYLSEDDFSLSGLTQEDPNYVSVVNETSDAEEISNFKELLKCAKQLGGGNDREQVVSSFDESNIANISNAVVAELELEITKKAMTSSDSTSTEEVCVDILCAINF